MNVGSTLWPGFLWVTPRPAGLSDDEDEEEEDLRNLALLSLYGLDDEISCSEPHGLVYRVTFISGLKHQFLIMTSLWFYFQFQGLSPQQSSDLLRRELVSCAHQQSYTAAKQLEQELFLLGISPQNFLERMMSFLPFMNYEIVWI